MKKTFKEYAEQRMIEEVALLLWAAETDIKEFSETVLVLAQNKKLTESNLMELGWNAPPSPMSGAQTLGSVLGQKAANARNALGQKMQSGQAAMASGQPDQKLQQATHAVQNLQNQLRGYGYNQNTLSNAFSPLMQALQQGNNPAVMPRY